MDLLSMDVLAKALLVVGSSLAVLASHRIDAWNAGGAGRRVKDTTAGARQ